MYTDISQLTPENQWDPMWDYFMPEPDISQLTPQNQWNPIWNQVAPGYGEQAPFDQPAFQSGAAPPWIRPTHYMTGYGYTDPANWANVLRLLGEAQPARRSATEQKLAFDRGTGAELHGFGPQAQPPVSGTLKEKIPTTLEILASLSNSQPINQTPELNLPVALQPDFFRPYGISPTGYGDEGYGIWRY